MNATRRLLFSGGLATIPVAALAASELGVGPDLKTDQSRALQKAIDSAIAKGADLYLPPGKYIAGGLSILKPLRILGTPGLTVLRSPDGNSILEIAGAKHVTLSGLTFDGRGKKPEGEAFRKALASAAGCEHLLIEACEFLGSETSGLALDRCSGRIVGNRAGFIEKTGIFAFDSAGLEISGNHVHDIGNNGIQVWRTDQKEDGTIVSNNRVERVAFKDGGNGQNGNGINIWKAGNVLVSNNRVSDCGFSAIRNNSGHNCQIVGNNCSRLDETAIFVEFAYEGAVVANNLIESAASGISITNLDQNGRLAVCSGNLVRKMSGAKSNPESTATGIHGEGEVAITGNVVEEAGYIGISLGWGPYCRTLSAVGNTVRDCGIGITASLYQGASEAMIANNFISGAKTAAIAGMDHKTPVTGDLAKPGAEVPAQLKISGNVVS
jgi:uncharacterized secreted repeat protein (TIGR03808 family)